MRDAEPREDPTSSVGWHLERPRRRAMPVVWAALAALLGWFAWTLIQDGEPLSAALALVIAAGCAWMILPPRRVPREPRVVPTGHGLGLLLPMQAKSWRFVVLGSLAIVLALVAGVRGLLDREILPALVVLGIGVLAAIAMVDELQMRRRGPRGLVLTPAGIALHDRNPAQTWPWHKIGDVHAWHTFVAPRHNDLFRPRSALVNQLTLTERPPGAVGRPEREQGHGDADVDADNLLCDPVTAFRLLRLYAGDPSLRWELGSDAALRRWATLAG